MYPPAYGELPLYGGPPPPPVDDELPPTYGAFNPPPPPPAYGGELLPLYPPIYPPVYGVTNQLPARRLLPMMEGSQVWVQEGDVLHPVRRLSRSMDHTIIASTFVEEDVILDGDEILAAFTRASTSGTVSRGVAEELLFDASASVDPSDPSNSAQAMRFLFSCQQPDGISGCFNNTGGFYNGRIVDGNRWRLDVNQFVNDADEFIITATVRKGSTTRGNLREAIATRTIKLRPAEQMAPINMRIDQDCGGNLCDGVVPSNNPIAFTATVRNAGAFSGATFNFRWLVDGEPVRFRHLLVKPTGVANTSAEVDMPSITFNPHIRNDETSILPRSGIVAVECQVDVIQGTMGATGTTLTIVELEGPPICTTGTCLVLDESEQDIPNFSFRAIAEGFSSANDLGYEFGFVKASAEDGAPEFEVVRADALENVATMSAQEDAGNYTVFVVAVDQVTGGRSAPQFAMFTLNPEGLPDGVSEGDECRTKKDADNDRKNSRLNNIRWSNLENSGDPKAPQSGMAFANANNNAAFQCLEEDTDYEGRRSLAEAALYKAFLQDGGSRFERIDGSVDPTLLEIAAPWHQQQNKPRQQQLQPMRQLLATRKSDAEIILQGLSAVLTTLEGASVPDALGALSAIQDTFPVGNSPDLEQAKVLAKIVVRSLRVLNEVKLDDVGTVTIQRALRNAGLAAERLSESCGNACVGDQSPWRRVDRVMDSLISARDLMRRTSPSGLTSTAVSTRIAQAVSRNTLAATSTANVAIDVSVLNRGELTNLQLLQAGAFISTPTTFADWCRSNTVCNARDHLALYLSYVRDAAVYTKATTSFPNVVPAHFSQSTLGPPAAISGVFEVQFDFKGDGDRICSATVSCNMNLRIPINGGVDMTGKGVACVRLVPNRDTEAFTASVVQSSLAIADGTHVTCQVTRLGRYMVMSYTLPPSPFPPPPGAVVAPRRPPPPSPSPQPPAQGVAPAPPAQGVAPAPPPGRRPLLPPAEEEGIEVCERDPRKRIRSRVEFNLNLNANDKARLEERMQLNMGRLLGRQNGLTCPVELTEDNGAAGQGRRSLLAFAGNMDADLGRSTSVSQVLRARRVVQEVILRRDFFSVFVDGGQGAFVTSDGQTLVVTRVEAEDPRFFEGCNLMPSKIFRGRVMFEGDVLSAVRDVSDPDDRVELMDTLAEQMQEWLDFAQNSFIFSCLAQFTFVGFNIEGVSLDTLVSLGRRGLLSQHEGELLVDTGDEATFMSFIRAITAVQPIRFEDDGIAVNITGVEYPVTHTTWDPIPREKDSKNRAKVLGPAISIPVFFFLVAVGFVAYRLHNKRKLSTVLNARATEDGQGYAPLGEEPLRYSPPPPVGQAFPPPPEEQEGYMPPPPAAQGLPTLPEPPPAPPRLPPIGPRL